MAYHNQTTSASFADICGELFNFNNLEDTISPTPITTSNNFSDSNIRHEMGEFLKRHPVSSPETQQQDSPLSPDNIATTMSVYQTPTTIPLTRFPVPVVQTPIDITRFPVPVVQPQPPISVSVMQPSEGYPQLPIYSVTATTSTGEVTVPSKPIAVVSPQKNSTKLAESRLKR